MFWLHCDQRWWLTGKKVLGLKPSWSRTVLRGSCRFLPRCQKRSGSPGACRLNADIQFPTSSTVWFFFMLGVCVATVRPWEHLEFILDHSWLQLQSDGDGFTVTVAAAGGRRRRRRDTSARLVGWFVMRNIQCEELQRDAERTARCSNMMWNSSDARDSLTDRRSITSGGCTVRKIVNINSILFRNQVNISASLF